MADIFLRNSETCSHFLYDTGIGLSTLFLFVLLAGYKALSTGANGMAQLILVNQKISMSLVIVTCE